MTDYDFLAGFLEALSRELEDVPGDLPAPPCGDRWLVRSALQKAIRRGHVGLARRAAVALGLFGNRYLWRALVVIAIEDVGIADGELVGAVLAAASSASWRRSMGDSRVASHLVRRMALAPHCQAACDLAMRCDAPLSPLSVRANVSAQVEAVCDVALPITLRARAAFNLAGVFDPQEKNLDALWEGLRAVSAPVASMAERGWKLTGEPMALLLPLVHEAACGLAREAFSQTDDRMLDHHLVDGFPTYALDRHTRMGRRLATELLAQERALSPIRELASALDVSGFAIVADHLFLVDGSSVRKRLHWPLGEELRSPVRPLPGALLAGDRSQDICQLLIQNWPLIEQRRLSYLTTAAAH